MGLTARLSLDLLGLQPGADDRSPPVAAGCYGGYVVQLAKADGLTVIADASEADTELVTSLGADIVVPSRRWVLPPRFANTSRTASMAWPMAACKTTKSSTRLPMAAGVHLGPWLPGRNPSATSPSASPGSSVYATEHAKLDQLRAQTEAGEVSLRVAQDLPGRTSLRSPRSTRSRRVLAAAASSSSTETLR